MNSEQQELNRIILYNKKIETQIQILIKDEEKLNRQIYQIQNYKEKQAFFKSTLKVPDYIREMYQEDEEIDLKNQIQNLKEIMQWKDEELKKLYVKTKKQNITLLQNECQVLSKNLKTYIKKQELNQVNQKTEKLNYLEAKMDEQRSLYQINDDQIDKLTSEGAMQNLQIEFLENEIEEKSQQLQDLRKRLNNSIREFFSDKFQTNFLGFENLALELSVHNISKEKFIQKLQQMNEFTYKKIGQNFGLSKSSLKDLNQLFEYIKEKKEFIKILSEKLNYVLISHEKSTFEVIKEIYKKLKRVPSLLGLKGHHLILKKTKNLKNFNHQVLCHLLFLKYEDTKKFIINEDFLGFLQKNIKQILKQDKRRSVSNSKKKNQNKSGRIKIKQNYKIKTQFQTWNYHNLQTPQNYINRIHQYVKTQDDEKVSAVIKIQRIYRGSRVRKQVKQLKNNDDEKVQQVYKQQLEKRATIQKQEDLKKLQEEIEIAAVKIQKVFKGKRSRKIFQEKKKNKELIKQEEAAVKIQKIYKGRKTRLMIQQMKMEKGKSDEELEQAVIKIQKVFKGNKVRKEINLKKQKSDQELEEAAIKIQKVFKGKKVRKQMNQKKEEKELENVAVKIQSVFKGKKVRKELKEQKDKELEDAAIKIQKVFKGKKVRKQIKQQQEKEFEDAAIKIQKVFKGKQVRKEIKQQQDKELEDAAIKIQKVFKGKKVRKEIKQQQDKELEDAAIKIQKVFKGKKVRKEIKQQQDKELEEAAIKIQKVFKGKQVRKELGKKIKQFKQFKKLSSQFKQMIINVQSQWSKQEYSKLLFQIFQEQSKHQQSISFSFFQRKQ